MTLGELIDSLTLVQEDCNWNAHPFGKASNVRVTIEGSGTADDNLEIVSVEPEHTTCGCIIGACIALKKKDDIDDKRI